MTTWLFTVMFLFLRGTGVYDNSLYRTQKKSAASLCNSLDAMKMIRSFSSLVSGWYLFREVILGNREFVPSKISVVSEDYIIV